MITERKICWPNPDATCLEGGCTWCDGGKWKSVEQLERYARKAGVLPNRGIGEKEAMTAFQTGVSSRWFGRVEVRMKP